MKTTNAYYLGSVQAKHDGLSTYLFDGGYVVEEKGVIFLSIEETKRLQNLRFLNEPELQRIDIMEPGQTPVVLLRNK